MDRLGDCGQDATCGVSYPLLVGNLLQQDDELIATESCDGVGAAAGRLQSTARCDQQLIASRVPEGVIDELELVQVAEEDCSPSTSESGSVERAGQAI